MGDNLVYGIKSYPQNSLDELNETASYSNKEKIKKQY